MTEKKNPWNVETLNEFLYYCCPECNEKDRSKDVFLEHALQEHPDSKDFLGKFKVKQELSEYEIGESGLCDVKKEYKHLEVECEIQEDVDVKIQDYNYMDEEDHLNYDDDVLKYECEFCQEELISLTEYTIHIKKFHENENSYHKIDLETKKKKKNGTKVDGKILKRKNHLKTINKDLDSNVPDGGYRCTICNKDKVFSKHKYLKRHIKDCHEREKPKKIPECKECGLTFSEKSELIEHKKSFHKILAPCHICGNAFPPGSLKIHIKVVHEGVKEHNCEQCGKTFGRKSALLIHQRRVHEGVKSEACKFCGKTFCDSTSLKLHTTTVHEGKREVCDLCGKSFSQLMTLKRHVETVHEKKKKYLCKLCGKKFTRDETLIVHMKAVHEGIRVKCDLCGKDFSQQSGLDLHKRNAHKVSSKTKGELILPNS